MSGNIYLLLNRYDVKETENGYQVTDIEGHQWHVADTLAADENGEPLLLWNFEAGDPMSFMNDKCLGLALVPSDILLAVLHHETRQGRSSPVTYEIARAKEGEYHLVDAEGIYAEPQISEGNCSIGYRLGHLKTAGAA